MAADELEDWLRLTSVPGLGAERQRSLLAAFGLPKHIFSAGRSSLAGVIGGKLADALLARPARDRVDPALAWAAEPGSHVLTLADEAYPPSLLEIPDPPVMLFVKGDPSLLQQPGLAVVGARSATAQGMANAEAFSLDLAARGLTIVSGLAAGIDAAAHRGALAAGPSGGRTIAVIGTGIDRIYPARNAALAREIAACGAIVSEFPLGTPPLQHNFPRRNRIIAGLAQGVLVIEAALNSGSLISARLATECGRDVFAIPGSIHSPLARGCHRLIRDGAKLVETAEDIIEELGGRPGGSPPSGAAIDATRHRPSPPSQASLAIDDEAARMLAAVGHDPVDLDTLSTRCGLTVDALYAILLPLELDGHLTRLPGGRFQRA